MARVIGVDHLVIRVGSFARSKRFYNDVLGALGFKLKYEYGGDHAGWSNGKTLFWIGEADEEGKKHKHRAGNIGFHHYAFELAKKQDVDDFYKVLVAKNVTVVDPPAEYPSYGKGYYAVYFLDPDGLKLEGMYFPPAKQKKPPAKKRKKR